MSEWKPSSLTTRELGRRVWASTSDDDVFGRSAQLAYYFFLALFPLLICLTAVLGLFASASPQLREHFMQYIAHAMPGDASALVTRTLDEVAKRSGGIKLSLGLLASLWAASAGMSAIMDTLNAVYDVQEGRGLIKQKAIAVGLTIASSVLLILALVIVLYGGKIAAMVGGSVGLGGALITAWKIVQWPIALGFLLLDFALIYYFAPDVEQPKWRWITAGAVAGLVLWLIVSVAMRVYLHFFNSYGATYGSLGAVIILLLWFYLTGAAILMGAEVNAEVEHAAAQAGRPDAKEKGEKTPSGGKAEVRQFPASDEYPKAQARRRR